MKIEIDHEKGEPVEEGGTPPAPTPSTSTPNASTPNASTHNASTDPVYVAPPSQVPEIEALKEEIRQLKATQEQIVNILNSITQPQPQDQGVAGPPQGGLGWLGPLLQLLQGLGGGGGGENKLTEILLSLAIDNLKSSADLNRAVAGAVVKKLLGEAVASELGSVVVEHG